MAVLTSRYQLPLGQKRLLLTFTFRLNRPCSPHLEVDLTIAQNVPPPSPRSDIGEVGTWRQLFPPTLQSSHNDSIGPGLIFAALPNPTPDSSPHKSTPGLSCVRSPTGRSKPSDKISLLRKLLTSGKHYQSWKQRARNASAQTCETASPHPRNKRHATQNWLRNIPIQRRSGSLRNRAVLLLPSSPPLWDSMRRKTL